MADPDPAATAARDRICRHPTCNCLSANAYRVGVAEARAADPDPAAWANDIKVNRTLGGAIGDPTPLADLLDGDDDDTA